MAVLEKITDLFKVAEERDRVETEAAPTPVPEWVTQAPKKKEPLNEWSIFCALADKYESGEWRWLRYVDTDLAGGYCIRGGLLELEEEDGWHHHRLWSAAAGRWERVVGVEVTAWNDDQRSVTSVIQMLRMVGDCANS